MPIDDQVDPREGPHSAAAPALGYYYQGMYALLVLMDAPDESSVSIETGDDVELHGNTPTLFQLKHHLADPPKLTVKSVDLWKTLAIWTQLPINAPTDCVLVTSAEVSDASSLLALTTRDADRTEVLLDLAAEAERVCLIRERQRQTGESLSFADRALGCERFNALGSAEKTALVDRIVIATRSVTIDNVPGHVAERLRSLLPGRISEPLAERLVEWWDRRVVLSLLERRVRTISKREMKDQLLEFATDFATSQLPDNFSFAQPDSLEDELGGTMEAQIRLVRGGQSRLFRAAKARWRARQQRDRWMDDNPGMAARIAEYDQQLIEFWKDRHEPMCDDSRELDETAKCARGLELLDWSHLHAASDLPPIQEGWIQPFLTQGSYQQLADQQDVGWHPDYLRLLRPEGEA